MFVWKEHEMGKACCLHRRDVKYIQNFSWKVRREETTLETKVQMGG
jgi:hypothetical protein